MQNTFSNLGEHLLSVRSLENGIRTIAPQVIVPWSIAPGHRLLQKQLSPDNIPLEIAPEKNCLSDDLSSM